MKLLEGVLLAVTLCAVCRASGEEPSLCNEDPRCECLESNPFLVDCSNFNLDEIPFTKETNFSTPWVADIGGNRIPYVPVLPSQNNLIMLKLRKNHISVINDSAFAGLTKLRNLDLSHCLITQETLTLDAFKGPVNKDDGHDPLPLETLDLSHNRLDGLDSHAFNHLLHLKTLLISDNPFKDFSHKTASAFAELTDLVKLDLSRCQLLRLPHGFLTAMRNLKELELEGNNFATVPDEVNYALSLEVLNLNRNPIKVISPQYKSAFHDLSSLRELYISNMPRLNIVDNESFSGLANLTVLAMHHNTKLRTIKRLAFMGTVEQSNSLQEVYLQENQLSALPEDLLPWSQLTVLNVQHNPWKCDCHITWLTQGTLQKMILTQTKVTRYIVCAGPEELMGRNLKDLVAEEYEFKCAPAPYLETNPNYYGPIIVATIFIGIFLLLSATVLFAYVLYVKAVNKANNTQRVHYTRAKSNDLESIAQSVYS